MCFDQPLERSGNFPLGIVVILLSHDSCLLGKHLPGPPLLKGGIEGGFCLLRDYHKMSELVKEHL